MRFVHNKYLLFIALFFGAIASSIIPSAFGGKPNLGPILFLITIDVMLWGLTLFVLSGITIITVNKEGISSWQIHRRIKLTWDAVREIGIGMVSVGRNSSQVFEGWAEHDYSLEVYVSPRGLSDYERICGNERGHFARRDHIHFCYQNNFLHIGTIPNCKKAICENYPGLLPPDLRTLVYKPKPSYAIRIPDGNGGYTEEWHYVRDYKKIYSNMAEKTDTK